MPEEPIVKFAEGAFNDWVDDLIQSPSSRLCIVADKSALSASGAEMILQPALDRHTISWFTDFEPNPKLEDVRRGLDLIKDSSIDRVVAIGGGTAIDLAKLIASLHDDSSDPRDVILGNEEISNDGISLTAIPTTAGTGSEATHFAVVYVDGNKFSLAHPSMLPNHAVIDPTLTHSLPPSVTAATGLDALCQALESIWSVNATDQSIAWAIDAAKLAIENIIPATNSPSHESRTAMCRAAHLAGKAINITKTTAAHALSYGLTSKYSVPHGLAVALMFGPVLEFNAKVAAHDCSDGRGAAHVRDRMQKIFQLLGETNGADAAKRIRNIIRQCGGPCSLDEVGVNTEEELRKLVATVNLERMSNNPRKAGLDTLVAVLRNSIPS